MRAPRLVVVTAVLATAAAAAPAAAQPADAKAAAEQLFAEGRDLAKKGNHAAACPKFEASLRLDPALGTRLNLADCYERTGKLASAWGLYREAVDAARRANDPVRRDFAARRAAAVEPRLPRLIIRVPAGAEVSGLVVTRDGAPVDRVLFDTAVYVDPGSHGVAATAPGHESFETEVTATEGDVSTVDIPPLPPSPSDAPGAEPVTGTDGLGSAPAHAAPSGGSSRATWGLVSGGAGAVSLAAGLGFGWSAKKTWDRAFDSGACKRETLECSPHGQELTDSARLRANVANALVGAGVVLVGVGAVLYLTAPDDHPAERMALVPVAGPDEIGFAVTGGF